MPRFLGYVLLVCLGRSIRCQTPADVNDVKTAKLGSYNPSVRPVSDQTDPIVLDVSLFLSSVNEVDEVNEKMVTTGYISLGWIDDLLQWSPATYNGVEEIHVWQVVTLQVCIF
jgi:hypothetical protein